jgi:ParB/RepB/Spo0J family partition protein
MPLLAEFHLLPLTSIQVDREARQRKVVEVEDLVQSIARQGVIMPIVVDAKEDGTFWLIAGERRLEASRQLGLPTIPARFSRELSQIELQMIELEENIRRQDLAWQDRMDAVEFLHKLLDLPIAQSAEEMGLSEASLKNMLFLARSCREVEELRQCGEYSEALNRARRRRQRVAGEALEDLIGSASEAFAPSGGSALTEGSPPLPATQTSAAPADTPTSSTFSSAGLRQVSPAPAKSDEAAPESILNQSFLTWAPTYSGPKFTVIHCDFPYGINLFSGPQGRNTTEETEQYTDTPEIYWQLSNCLLDNLDKFASLSCHLYFWLSMKYYSQTLELFRTKAPDFKFSTAPLIWGKSDNAGIIGDARRDPRHTYETCLFAHRNGRNVVKSVADFYSAPTDRALHPSAKPEPVLKHFLSMAVDDTISLLDPTCGSASALRAAEALGAKHVLGLEIEPETCRLARQALKNARTLRALK